MPLPSSGTITLAQIQTEFGGENPISLSEYYKGGAYVKATDAAPNVPTSGAISMGNFRGAARNVVGQTEYTTPGTYSWTCPADVTSVCVVIVGWGQPAYGNGSGSGQGNAGGSVAWGNNIPVTPGNTYTVKVASTYADPDSYFIDTATLTASHTNSSGTYRGGGGAGGASPANDEGVSTGGGGAGGYTGNGGSGGSPSARSGIAGAGGGGGGGGAGPSSDGWYAAAGGGVGLLGQGANGSGGAEGIGGSGGSGGSAGQNYSVGKAAGGNYGGGAGGTPQSGAPANGGGSAIRIIWGSGRAFPSTNTGNL